MKLNPDSFLKWTAISGAIVFAGMVFQIGFAEFPLWVISAMENWKKLFEYLEQAK